MSACCFLEVQWPLATASEGGGSCQGNAGIFHHMQSRQVTVLHYGPGCRLGGHDLSPQWATGRRADCEAHGGIDQIIASLGPDSPEWREHGGLKNGLGTVGTDLVIYATNDGTDCRQGLPPEQHITDVNMAKQLITHKSNGTVNDSSLAQGE